MDVGMQSQPTPSRSFGEPICSLLVPYLPQGVTLLFWPRISFYNFVYILVYVNTASKEIFNLFLEYIFKYSHNP